MERYYANLFDKKLGKLQSLREAQLWMLRERGMRGLEVPRPFTDHSDTPANNRLPPFFWGALVLSGNWR